MWRDGKEEEDAAAAGDIDELDGEEYDDISNGFKEMMRTTLTWHRVEAMDIWVFWTDDDDDDEDESESSPLLPYAPPGKPLLPNWRINMKLRTLIRKLLVEIEGLGRSLVQYWVLRKADEDDDDIVLRTADQPFGFNYINENLCDLRIASIYFDMSLIDGVIGHVFQKHITLITPNVKYYTEKEYSHRPDAVAAGIRSSCACPVFEPSGKSCIGVLEVLSTSPSIPTKTVNRMIEEVGLKSSGIQNHNISVPDYDSYHRALQPMKRGVEVVCGTHKLPLVQVWFRCKCTSCVDVKSAGSYLVSEKCRHDRVSYALDDGAKEFLRDCFADPLLPIIHSGQSVAGRTLDTYVPCFCRDVTRIGIAEYPLVHLARLHGLAGSFAICLRSIHTGDADYVLEFFLPRKRNDWDPRPLLCSVWETMKQQFPSFKVASGEALGEEISVEFYDISVDKKGYFQIGSNSDMHFQPMEDIKQLERSNNDAISCEKIGDSWRKAVDD